MDYKEIVGRNQAIYKEPPKFVPTGQNYDWVNIHPLFSYNASASDAIILGNGDMVAGFAGPPQWPQFWVSTNDFWQMESDRWDYAVEPTEHTTGLIVGGPRPIGRLVFVIDDLQNASYRAWQDFLTATTNAQYIAKDEREVNLKSYVAADENLLVVQITASAQTEVEAKFLFPTETGFGVSDSAPFLRVPAKQRKESDKGIFFATRSYTEHVDMPTLATAAGRFVGKDSLKIVLEPDKTETFVLSLRTWAKTARPKEFAYSRAAFMTLQEIEAIYERHLCWWDDYWSISGVELDDPVIEQRYYLSQYIMGSVSRDPDYPPGLYGIQVWDRPSWCGNYKINYNHQAPFVGLIVAGRFEQYDPHDAPYLALNELAREMSIKQLKHEGIYLPLGLGPNGMVSESCVLHMKSPAVHGVTNMAMRWYLTRDRQYAKRIYPFLRGVVDFWDHDLVLRDDGYLHIIDDGMHERMEKDVENGVAEDPVNTIGYIKSAIRLILDISAELGIDEHKRQRWEEILEKIVPYPSGSLRDIPPFSWRSDLIHISDLFNEDELDTQVFYNEGVGVKWTAGFPGNVMHIYPAGEIGLSSDEKTLKIARNTIKMRSIQEYRNRGKSVKRHGPAWNDGNLSSMFFPAAVRVGYDPDEIWEQMRWRIENLGLPNGYILNNPHGIENCSTIPNAIQEMALLSHENILRFFRVWPRKTHPNAAFFGLRAYGGFVVDAALKNGKVTDVTILSLKGRDLKIENPWKVQKVTVLRPYGIRDTFEGDEIVIPTVAGERIAISPEP